MGTGFIFLFASYCAFGIIIWSVETVKRCRAEDERDMWRERARDLLKERDADRLRLQNLLSFGRMTPEGKSETRHDPTGPDATR